MFAFRRNRTPETSPSKGLKERMGFMTKQRDIEESKLDTVVQLALPHLNASILVKEEMVSEEYKMDEDFHQDNYSGYSKENSPSKVFSQRFGAARMIITGGPSSCQEEQKSWEEDHEPLEEVVMCLDLLESTLLQDNRRGMERMIALVNSELVNSKGEESVAHALLCGEATNERSVRLRNVFSSYFFDEDGSISEFHSDDDDDDSASSCYSDDVEEYSGRHMGALKLPALRVLVSSLELVAMLEKVPTNKIDLYSSFWKGISKSMSDMIEAVSSHKLRAALSIKSIRLMGEMEPRIVKLLVRHSLLPFIIHAREFGSNTQYKMLVREADKLLASLGLNAN
jgi:hypothetical protein